MMKEYADRAYDIDYLMDAIHDNIIPIKESPERGYTFAYFLSGRFILYHNYVGHYFEKGDLIDRGINHILAKNDESKKVVFGKEHADGFYEEYKNHKVDDSLVRASLMTELRRKKILLFAPGATMAT